MWLLISPKTIIYKEYVLVGAVFSGPVNELGSPQRKTAAGGLEIGRLTQIETRPSKIHKAKPSLASISVTQNLEAEGAYTKTGTQGRRTGLATF